MPSNIIRFLSSAALLLSFSQTAHAGAYGTLGFSIEDIQPDDQSNSFTATGINARLGYNFGQYFGLEAEGQLGLSGDGDNPVFIGTAANGAMGVILDDNLPGFTDITLIRNRTFDYKGGWGLYLRPQLPVTDNLSLSLRAGFGGNYFDRTFETFEFPGGALNVRREENFSEGYGALGVGVEYNFGERKKDSLRMDVTRRFRLASFSDGEDEAFQDGGVTVSYARKF